MAVVERVLFTRLSTHAGVKALVGTRIEPMRARQNLAKPYVTYARIPGGERAVAMGSNPGVVAGVFQIDCWASTPLEAYDLAHQVRLALERWRDGTTDPVILDSFLDREPTDIDEEEEPPELYRRSMDVRVWYREAQS